MGDLCNEGFASEIDSPAHNHSQLSWFSVAHDSLFLIPMFMYQADLLKWVSNVKLKFFVLVAIINKQDCQIFSG
mgnify:CR=1 FL=1